MALPIWQRTITTEVGDVVPGAEVEVVNEATGLPADIFSDRLGETERSNPFFANSNGFAQFYAAPGEYRVTATGVSGSQTWRWNVLVGTAATVNTGTDPGEVPLNSDLGTAATADISTLTWTATAPGETRGLFVTDAALYPPTDSPLFRYVILTEGQDGVGGYNEGLLINETITGSGVERQVTAEISLAGSPLDGTVVHLINSERSHLRPGETAGVFEQDQMQRITGIVTTRGEEGATGAFSYLGSETQRPLGDGIGSGPIPFNSANSPNARTSTDTDGETRVKSVSQIVFLRIA